MPVRPVPGRARKLKCPDHAWQAFQIDAVLPELGPALKRHGHLVLSEDVRERLLDWSPATADWLLRPLRREDKLRGINTTRRGTLLKHQVPVRKLSRK